MAFVGIGVCFGVGRMCLVLGGKGLIVWDVVRRFDDVGSCSCECRVFLFS